MRRPLFSQALFLTAVGVSVIALVLAIALPYVHDDSVPSDSDQWCRTCQLSSSFSATTPPTMPVISLHMVFVSLYTLWHHTAPRTICVIRLPASRAPPSLC